MSIFNKQSLFWNKVFDYEDNITYLPHSKTSSFQKNNGEIVSEHIINSMLSIENSQRVMALTNSSPMAIYMVLLSGVKSLLYKYTGNKNIIVGMPALKDKNQSSLNEILIIKNKFYKTSSFKDIFKEINMFIKDVIGNQNIPFRKMVENLDIEYDDNHLPKINTIISLDDLHSSHFKETTASDVRFEFYIEDNLIKLRLAYNQDLYDRAFMKRVTEHLNRIFSVILFQPTLEISQLNMMSKLEEEKILTEFNNSKINYQGNTTVHELFENRVKSKPNQVAVDYDGQYLTYKQLNVRANQVARTLRTAGIKNEELVGIMLDRSLEMIIGILGILKAGGAYVPIDPDYPEERIQYIITNSNIKQLLTKRYLQDRVSLVEKSLYLDEESSYHDDGSNLTCNVLPYNLAYVIYTSGTTGKPKGVMVEHQSVINTLTQLENLYPLEKNDSILLKTNYTFDVSITELFGWFFGQGRLVILKPNFEKEPMKMLNIIQDKQITHINFVPSMLKVFLDDVKIINEDKLGSLKYVFSAGEALPVNTIKQFYDLSLTSRLENIYGPTEATIYATHYSTTHNMEGYVNTPIGKPLGNTQAYIINRDNQLQPVGLVGELCLSGQGLARGYLNRPDLTGEKFVENPFIPGQKMYRTGDLVRRLPDGNIEYLGRIDHQVKIRGYRIEIGEVETALLNEEVIKEAIVTEYEDVHGNNSLCAYIVVAESFSLSQLKRELLGGLPSYMIPSYFVQLEQLPLTPNGKVNRKGLPAPSEDLHVISKYVAPRTAIEQALVAVWQAILGVKRIGILDNFYELGGDSIKSIQVSSRLYQEDYKVEMKHLLKYPTIAELSHHVYPIMNTTDQGEITGTAPLTPIQSWFFNENFVDNHFNQAMMLYSSERFESTILEQVMTQIIKHHDALRSVFIKQNNQYEVRIRGNEEGPLFSLELFDLQNEENVESIIEGKANLIQSSINIEEGPLVKLGLFQCVDGDHLLIVIHHLVIDMVSWRILFEDLATGYEQLKSEKPIHLPPKTDSFKQWSTLLFGYAQGSEIEKERVYWNQVEQVQYLPLPKDYELKFPTNENNDVITVEWSEQETEQLLKQANISYNTEINDLLLTALGSAVHKWTGIKNVIVNLEGHGRETILPDVNITRTVGWFTSQYPVILQMNSEQSVSDSIKTVKEGLRKIPNKGIGYGILRYLSQDQSAIKMLKPEISFNYLGQFDQDLVRNSLELSSYSSGLIISKQTNRQYVLNINGFVQNGKLFLMIEYSKNQYQSKTMEQLDLRQYLGHI